MEKSNNFLILILISLFFSSCSGLYFTESQPKGSPAFAQVPHDLLGNYMVMGEMEDEAQIFYNIHSKGFVLYQEHDFTISIDSLEKEELYIKDSLLYMKAFDNPDDSNGFPFILKNDSLMGTYYRWEEQLIGKDVVLTLDKGNYYLNTYEEDKGGWACLQVETIKNGHLLIWAVDISKEEKLIKETISAFLIKPDSDQMIANPNKRQFRKFVKKGGFGGLLHLLHKLEEDDLPELMLNKISEK